MSAPPDLRRPTRLLIEHGALDSIMLPIGKRLENASSTIRLAFGRDAATDLWDKCKQSKRRNLLRRVTQFSNWRN